MSNPGAGNSPIVKLEDLVVGTSYRLLDPTLSAHITDHMGDIGEEYKKNNVRHEAGVCCKAA